MKKKFKSEMLSSIIDVQCRTDQVQQNLLSTLALVSGWKGVFLVGRSAVSMPVWSTMRADPMHSSEAKAAGQMLKDVSHVFSFIQLVTGWVNQMATWNEWFQSGRAHWARRDEDKKFLSYRSGLGIHSDHRKQKHKKGTEMRAQTPEEISLPSEWLLRS